jgi:hypothetical protein
MCDQWMPRLKLDLSADEFDRLPRSSAYRYEYVDHQAWLTPRPKFYHARLDLERYSPGPFSEAAIRPLEDADWDGLRKLFAAAFCLTEPFACISDAERAEAARECLHRTRTGGDGPLIEQACRVAVDPDSNSPVGAVLITLLPREDPTRYEAYYWTDPPPADAVERRRGRPHLTWIFVAPLEAGRGLGTALLSAAVAQLREMGFTDLITTFIKGNDASMLWHWSNGFELLPHPASRRNWFRNASL